MHDPLVMFGTHPKLTGRSGQVVLGKKSGKASIQYKLEELGIQGVGEDKLDDILGAVKEKGIAKKDILTDDEFIDIVKSVAA